MNISVFDKCSNCGACSNICPKGAISVRTDDYTYTLSVAEDKCIDCGVCVDVCPVNNETKNNLPIYAVAGWHKDKNVVDSSSSGGMFHALAKRTLAEGGVVFGAAYSDDCRRVEIMSTDEVSLSALQKSKYVESLVGDSFPRIKNELKKGRKVLFCGTPCQVAGLHSYLQKSYDGLVTCDFACGGVPAHSVYEEYLSMLEKRYRSSVINVDFRPKTHGWRRYAVSVDFANGKNYNRLGTEDPYLRSFLLGKYTDRDYCLECKFSDCHAADITLADFWLHKKLSKLNNSLGISLVLCNTEKGAAAVKDLQDEFVTEELELGDACYNNKPTVTPEQKIQKHRMFKEVWVKKGIKAACHRVAPSSLKERVKDVVVRRRKRRKDKK